MKTYSSVEWIEDFNSLKNYNNNSYYINDFEINSYATTMFWSERYLDIFLGILNE